MHEVEYKSYYWNNINVNLIPSFIGATDLYDINGNVCGQLLLNLFGGNTETAICFKEELMFILKDGSLGFSFGISEYDLLNNFTGMAGVVSDKSGVYTKNENILYYFESIEKNKWKITFRFNK